MRRHYSTRRLTVQEWIQIEEVLLDEMEIQCWYGIAFLNTFGGETLVVLQ